MDKFKIKPNRERTSLFSLRFLHFLLWFTAFFLCVYFISSALSGHWLLPLKHVFFILICCTLLSLICAIAVERLGSNVFSFLTVWSDRKIPPQEQFSADLAKARFSKSKGQFKEALIIINEILRNSPEFPEALLLKAQIAWEGYENKELARRNLDKILRLVKDDDPIHRWAVNYYHEIGKKRSD